MTAKLYHAARKAFAWLQEEAQVDLPGSDEVSFALEEAIQAEENRRESARESKRVSIRKLRRNPAFKERERAQQRQYRRRKLQGESK